ncbi:MAG TPA: PAS domain-containing sensor histidine kinase [Mucilaginibacter sp.]|nr:PAS domain-containing sensor histidine kinase [Mucilaginibacter sp.]
MKKYLLTGARIMVVIVACTGFLGLLGWQLNAELLKRPVAGLVAMNPLTALCFVLVSLSFYLLQAKFKDRQKKISGLFLAATIILAALIRIANAAGLTAWQIDHALFAQAIKMDAAHSLSSSMAVNTALAFILSASALLLLSLEKPKYKWAHFIALAVFLFGFFSLLGYLYRAPEFYDLLRYLPMAVSTAVCFILTALAILFLNPDKGLTNEFIGSLPGSLIGRIVMPLAVAIPVGLALLFIYLHEQFRMSAQLNITLFVFLTTVIFCAVILYSVKLLNQKEMLRAQAEEARKKSEQNFALLINSVQDYAIFMLDTAGNIITWNDGAEAIKGYTAEEIKGKPISIFYSAEDIKQGAPQRVLEMAAANGRHGQEGWRIRKDGTRFWADVVVTALFDEDGKLQAFAKVTRDMTERKKMDNMLRDFNAELSRQVHSQTLELEETTAQLRQLSSHLQTAREEERRYIAREIHDELGQMLTGLRMDIVWLRKKMTGADGTVTERFEKSLELLGQTRQTVRQLSSSLHPSLMEDLGLTAAISALSSEFEERWGLKVAFKAQWEGVDEMGLSRETSIGIYRVFQESLTNVAKHAQATEVKTMLYVENNNLVLSINDNGKGFDTKAVAGGKTLGLLSIRERALMMRGKFELETAQHQGTTVRLIVPLH